MKFRVIHYREGDDSYHCLDESGKAHKIDFHVSGSDIIKQKYLNRKDLEGKTVTVDYVQAYLELAGNVSKVEDSNEKTKS